MLGLADGQPVVLSPLEGSSASALVLDNGDLPKQGVEASAKLRMTSTDYPGSLRRSVQLLGIDEADIVLQGQLRDVWGFAEGHAAAQWAALRAMFVAQILVELTWGQLLVRRGYVSQIRPTYRSEAVIDYQLTFHVVQADEASVISQPLAPEEPRPDDLFDQIDKVTAQVDEMLALSTAGLGLLQLAT